MKSEIGDILDIDALKETFIFANTPLYLYKNFRKNGSIQELSKRYSSNALIEYFENAMKKKIETLETLIFIYSIIIALTFKNYSEIKHFFSKLSNYDLEWSKELKEVFMSSVRITQILSIDENYKTKVAYDLHSSESVNDLTIEGSKPKMIIKGELR